MCCVCRWRRVELGLIRLKNALARANFTTKVVYPRPLTWRKRWKLEVNKSAWQFKKAQRPSSNLRATAVCGIQIKMLKRVNSPSGKALEWHQIASLSRVWCVCAVHESTPPDSQAKLCVFFTYRSKFVCPPRSLASRRARQRRRRTFTPCGHTQH